MKYLIVLVFFISSCCPKTTSTITSSIDTTTKEHSDTNTKATIDTTKLPPIVIHDTINMSSFCDSLNKGLSPAIHLKVNRGSIKIKSDSVGLSKVECQTYSLIQVTKIQQTTINNLKEQLISTTINKEAVVEQPIYKNPFFWIVCGVILLLSYFAFRKR